MGKITLCICSFLKWFLILKVSKGFVKVTEKAISHFIGIIIKLTKIGVIEKMTT